MTDDIFDTGSPPSYAHELYDRFVINLQQTDCHLIMLAGNHGSVATFNESHNILAFLNTTVVASADHVPQVLPRRDGTPGVILCLVPLLRPRDIITSQTGLAEQERRRHLPRAITDYYQQQYQDTCMLHGDRNLPIIVTGHLTTVGASKSNAVCDIYISTLNAFPAQNFPPADCIALGHVHQTRVVDGTDHVRYYGSPIALSFDECGKDKCVHLMSFEAGKLSTIESLTVPATQPLMILEGDLTATTTQFEQWHNILQEPPIQPDIEITTDDYLHDTQHKIRVLTEDLPVEVLLVRHSQGQRERIMASERRETLSELSIVKVFDRHLALEELEEPQRERLDQLFNTTLYALAEESET